MKASLVPALGLLFAPALTAAAALLFPYLVLPDAAADVLQFTGGAAAGVVALAIAARAELPPRAALALGAGGLLLLAAELLAAPHAPNAVVAVTLGNLGLTSLACAAGGAIGRRVAHPGHLLPACAVAAAADVASVIHPAGPSHAIAANERALSFFTIGFPVPGTRAVAPVLGLGDLLFIALVFGVAAAHRLSVARAAAAAALGLAAACALAAFFGWHEMPALVPVGVAVVALVPQARQVRAEDRRTTVVAITIAAGVVVGLLVARR